MDFSLSEEQGMLQDSVSRFVAQDYSFDKRERIVDSAAGYSADYWRRFADLGWLMIPFSEADGGLGGSAVDLMVIMQEFGKGIVVEPFLATAVLGGGLIAEAGSAKQKETLLGALMAGELQLAFAFTEPQSRYNLADVATEATREGDDYVVIGHKAVVLNAPIANQLIVAVRTSGGQREREGISLLLVAADSPGIRLQPYATVDGQRAADVYFDDVRVPASQLLGNEGSALPVIEKVIDRATLAVCAEALGAMETALWKTVDYTKTRKQFGVSISSFQALQHRMADMFIELEQARSIVQMAVMQCDANKGVAPRAISAAKSRVGKAARLVGQESVQLHGGIGVMEELDLGHFFKRLTTIQFLFGSTDYHTRRFSQL
ncbi:MAG TPA: acyl-CoA dehydrogenase [Xanthomonadales bacterium]|nr:acyl-CoA dehydrogenase [Xanthomonadales bacterium]